nr:hypothetical protein Csa_3G009470 [Ipomoea batatas]
MELTSASGTDRILMLSISPNFENSLNNVFFLIFSGKLPTKTVLKSLLSSSNPSFDTIKSSGLSIFFLFSPTFPPPISAFSSFSSPYSLASLLDSMRTAIRFPSKRIVVGEDRCGGGIRRDFSEQMLENAG